MMIFKENKKTGLQCGINDYGELFFGDDRSGYNLTDTPENREHILVDLLGEVFPYSIQNNG